jgi:hypothetical protein
MPTLPMPQLKEQMSALAEKIASDGFALKLDYSVASLKHVERILGEIHKEYKQNGSEEGLHGIALEFGAYIVKIIERHFGPAEWLRDDPSMGKDTFPLQWRGTTLFPVAWCGKRIFDGPADDIVFKFDALVQQKASESV